MEQCDGKVDAIVIGAGTGGTITGIARKFKERIPNCKVTVADGSLHLKNADCWSGSCGVNSCAA